MTRELEPPEHDIERPPEVAGDAVLRVFRVAPEHAGMRADVFVQSQLRNTSRTRARAIIENSAFDASGRRLRPSDRLRAEMRVALWRPPFDEPESEAPIGVVYQDEHLLVVDKPAPMTVHPTARHHHHTLIKRLEAERPGEFLSLVHRLDQETSGLLLVARSAASDRAFKRLLEDRSLAVAMEHTAGAEASWDRGRTAAARRGAQHESRFQKTYLAITRGEPECELCELPLEADTDNPLRVKMRVAAPGSGLPARTGIQLLERRAGYALLRCELYTGRQHQIRLHLSALGCPIVGDKLYGPDDRLLARAADNALSAEDHELLELPRHALHAHRYRLPHALSGAALDLVAELPDDLRSFWESKPR